MSYTRHMRSGKEVEKPRLLFGVCSEPATIAFTLAFCFNDKRMRFASTPIEHNHFQFPWKETRRDFSISNLLHIIYLFMQVVHAAARVRVCVCDCSIHLTCIFGHIQHTIKKASSSVCITIFTRPIINWDLSVWFLSTYARFCCCHLLVEPCAVAQLLLPAIAYYAANYTVTI